MTWWMPNGFLWCLCLSQLTDDIKKEKEKEPEKPEKPEILSFKKKGFELEKKDSDDSDEVSSNPHESQRGLKFIVAKVIHVSPLHFLFTGNQEGYSQAVQEETSENEQTHSGRAQTGKTDFFVFSLIFFLFSLIQIQIVRQK